MKNDMKKFRLFWIVLLAIFWTTNLFAVSFTEKTSTNLPNMGKGASAVGDINNDGKLDIVMTGFTASNTANTYVYFGVGDGTFTESTMNNATTGILPKFEYSAIALGDYDKDGDLDLLVNGYVRATGLSTTKLYTNSGSPDYQFVENTSASTTFAQVNNGNCKFLDYNNDGWLDVFVAGRSDNTAGGTGGSVPKVGVLYKNNGNGTFTQNPTTAIAPLIQSNTCPVDYDNDGDIDIVQFGYPAGGTLGYSKNNGDETFTNLGRNTTLNAANNAGAYFDLVDIYGTGIVRPMLYINSTSLTLYSVNASTFVNSAGTAPTFSPALLTGLLGHMADRSLAWADYDNDGLLDVLVTSITGPLSKLYRQTTAGSTFTEITDFTLPGVRNANVIWADFDNDGKLDIFITGNNSAANTYEGTSKIFLNAGTLVNVSNKAVAPIGLTYSGASAAGFATLTWNKTTDNASGTNETPETALTYNLRIGTTPGGSEILNPMLTSAGNMKVPGFGKIRATVTGTTASYLIKGLAAGTYYWSVQAIDNTYTPGNWATEGTFDIPEDTSTPVTQSTMAASPATSITQTSLNLIWTNGSGNKTVVFAKAGSNSSDLVPLTANTVYSASSVFGGGTQIGTTGWYCVYNNTAVVPGSTSNVTISGLTGLTSYQFMVCSYNGNSGNTVINYLTTSSTNNPFVVSTADYAAPTTVFTGLTVITNTTGTSVEIKPSQSPATSVYPCVVFIKEGSNASEDVSVVSNTTYTGNPTFANGSQVGTSGWYCVYNGNSPYAGSSQMTTFSAFIGLKYNTSYQVRSCTYNGTHGLEKFSATAGVVFATPAAGTTTFQSSGNWSTYSNWTAGQPGATTKSTINSNCNIDIDANLDSITINPSAKLTLNSGQLLTAEALTLNGDDASTGTFVNNGTATITSATVNQYMTSGRNWYVSSPVVAAPYTALSRATSVQYWDETIGDWGTKTSGTLDPGKGYISIGTATTGTITFTGTLNDGNIPVNLTRTQGVTKEGFNLVGNPYPSYLSWDAVEKNNVESSIWYRTKNAAGTYKFGTYNATGSVGTNVGVNATDLKDIVTGNIPPMQAFWVRVLPSIDGTSTTGSLVFKNTMRSHKGTQLQGDGITYNDANLRSQAVNTSQVVRLQVSNDLNQDEAIVLFNGNASNGLDSYDSEKMSNNSVSIPEIYSLVGNNAMAINGMSSIESNIEIPLGFKTLSTGSFSIKASEIRNFDEGSQIFLKDYINGTPKVIDLTNGSSYNFTSDLTTTNTRFGLLIKSLSTVTKLGNVEQFDAQISSNQFGQILVATNKHFNDNDNVRIYNNLGQLMETSSLKNKATFHSNSYVQGLYIVSLTVKNEVKTYKILIK